jgi:DUF971 family protein
MNSYQLLSGGSGKWCLQIDGTWCASGHCPNAAPMEVIGRQAKRFIGSPTYENHHILHGGGLLDIAKVGLTSNDLDKILSSYNRKKEEVEKEKTANLVEWLARVCPPAKFVEKITGTYGQTVRAELNGEMVKIAKGGGYQIVIHEDIFMEKTIYAYDYRKFDGIYEDDPVFNKFFNIS